LSCGLPVFGLRSGTPNCVTSVQCAAGAGSLTTAYPSFTHTFRPFQDRQLRLCSAAWFGMRLTAKELNCPQPASCSYPSKKRGRMRQVASTPPILANDMFSRIVPNRGIFQTSTRPGMSTPSLMSECS